MNKQDKKEIMNLIKYKKMLGGRRMRTKKALLNTEFVNEEWIRERNKQWNLDEEDIANMIKADKLLNGQVAILSTETFGLDGADYPIYGLENDEIFKEYIWDLEQDPIFGAYIDDREAFDKDWDNDEYDPCGVVVIPEEFIKEWIDD